MLPKLPGGAFRLAPGRLHPERQPAPFLLGGGVVDQAPRAPFLEIPRRYQQHMARWLSGSRLRSGSDQPNLPSSSVPRPVSPSPLSWRKPSATDRAQLRPRLLLGRTPRLQSQPQAAHIRKTAAAPDLHLRRRDLSPDIQLPHRVCVDPLVSACGHHHHREILFRVRQIFLFDLSPAMADRGPQTRTVPRVPAQIRAEGHQSGIRVERLVVVKLKTALGPGDGQTDQNTLGKVLVDTQMGTEQIALPFAQPAGILA